MINYSNKNKNRKKNEFIKKKIIYPLCALAAIVLVLFAGNKVLDKIAFRNYDVKVFMGANRYETGNVVNEGMWKGAKNAIIINTEYLHDAVSAVPYAYDNNMPVYFTKKTELDKSVLTDLKKRKIETVVIAGGINSVADDVQRALERNGFKTKRIVAKRGTELSMKFAKLMNDRKKLDEIAVVMDKKMNVPNGISFMPIASNRRIPVIVMKEKDRDDVIAFIRSLGIKKTYIIGNEQSINTSTVNLMPGAEVIKGEDRFKVNKEIIRKFFKKGHVNSVYITKGGVTENENSINVGDFINSLSSANRAAKDNAPIMFSKEDYLTLNESDLLDDLGIRKINEVGFRLKRRSLLNPERLRVVSAVSLMVISLILVVSVIRRETN